MGFGHVEHNVNMKFNRNLLLGKANTYTPTRREFMDPESAETTFLGIFYGLNRSFYLEEREIPMKI